MAALRFDYHYLVVIAFPSPSSQLQVGQYPGLHLLSLTGSRDVRPRQSLLLLLRFVVGITLFSCCSAFLILTILLKIRRQLFPISTDEFDN
jgi:hypothetical protein